MMASAKWLLLCASLSLSGCLATALAASSETTVDWKEKCEAKCHAKTYPVRMYHVDGHVQDANVAIYDFTNNIGCFCPAPSEKK